VIKNVFGAICAENIVDNICLPVLKDPKEKHVLRFNFLHINVLVLFFAIVVAYRTIRRLLPTKEDTLSEDGISVIVTLKLLLDRFVV
jgi:hypothetical protein